MKELEAIRKHPLFQEFYYKLEQKEQNRIFCRHQMEHLLDVARIAYILNLERNLNLRKEVIYGAALLHDIGKYRQYAEGVPHELASADLAEQILSGLPSGMYTLEEIEEMLQAIRGHRRLREHALVLESLLYESDKKSRMCFACAAEGQCNWDGDKKNLELEV